MKVKTKSRISATLVIAVFMATNTVSIASEISGINPVNGVYNITPKSIIKGGKIGYRDYKNFNLDKGDTANLNYNQGINTFVNLVDNKININGIVNTVKNNSYYGGNAVFVSPKGIVIGDSGVLNAGSLTINTPRAEAYAQYKTKPEEAMNGLININKNASVIINGNINTTNGTEINSGTVTINKSALINNSLG